MATALTAGKIYFIESDGSSNQDWITANSGDPDAIDLDSFTEGIEYIEMNIPKGFTDAFFTGAEVSQSGSARGFDLRNERRFYRSMSRGVSTNLANANLVRKFFMLPRHTSGAAAIFKRYYLIVYFGTNSHLEFLDNNGDVKHYCKGILLNGISQWISSDSLNILLRLNWESVW